MNFKVSIREAISDYAGQTSSGRIAMWISIAFAIICASTGFAFGVWCHDAIKLPQLLSYCANNVLMFLGAAFTFYGSSKLTEGFTKKWAPTIAKTVLKNDTLSSALETTAALTPSEKEPTNGNK